MSKDSDQTNKDSNTHKFSDQIPIKVKQCIDDVAKSEGYVTYSFDCNTTSTEGANYLGVLYEIDIKGETSNGVKETNTFVKYTVPLGDSNMLNITDIFEREAFFYNEVAVIFEKYQEDANILVGDRYQTCKHYYSDGEIVILENANRLGYHTLQRMELVSLEVAEKFVENLAKFHALSFILMKRQPEFYEQKIKPLTMPVVINDSMKKFVDNINELVINALVGDAKQKMKEFAPSLLEKFFSFSKFDNSLTCCMCHGDYRPNNILMLGDNDVVSKAITIDYQTIHCASPVKDFLHLMITCTDQKFRRENLDHLKELYFCSMGKFLEKFNLDIEEIYPKEEFDKSFKSLLDYVLVVAVLIVPFMFVFEDDVPEFGDPDAQFNCRVEFNDRIQGIVEDYISWCD